jgi:hypothetical protein
MTKISNQYSLTNVLTADVVNGRVGIGTASPSVQLDITGVDNTTTSIFSKVYSNNRTVWAGIGYQRLETNGDLSVVAGGEMVLRTSGSERMRITSAGNVGIGTNSPGELLTLGKAGGGQVFQAKDNTTNYSIGYIQFNTDNMTLNPEGGASGTTGYFRFITSNTERMRITQYGNVLVNATSSAYGASNIGYNFGVKGTNNQSFISIARANQTLDSEGIIVGLDTSNAYMIVHDNIPLNFSTNATERMRITSGGNVLMGMSSAIGTETLNIAGTVGGSANYGILLSLNSSVLTAFAMRFYNAYAGTVVGSITMSTSSTAYNTSSDYRLKEDLKEINGLDKVLAIKTYDFKWKNENSRMDGVLAHELQEVLPYAVHGKKDAEEMQSVDYSKIVPVLVAAIQQQQTQINELKALINA